jgi:site-specific DNA-methyltransferase (adenine-specific)
VEAVEVGGFQDGAGGNAFSRARVRTNTQRHGGDVQAANVGFQSWCQEWAAECLRVLTPGGHLLAFGGSRTYHRLTCAVEDAGFEIRDTIAWLYGSGFPKSLDVSKAIDKAAGAEREVVGSSDRYRDGRQRAGSSPAGAWTDMSGATFTANGITDITAPATPDAERWQGWGTALKPAHEPIVVARKPLVGTVVASVLAYGTGAINVDAGRIDHASDADRAESEAKNQHAAYGSGPRENRVYGTDTRPRAADGNYDGSKGRWPANVVLDEESAAELDAQTGDHPANRGGREADKVYGSGWSAGTNGERRPTEVGGASRFFYTAKAPGFERIVVDGISHPTVKPLDVMRWLVRLVTPQGGRVLDLFAGSGTTGEACLLERFDVTLIEKDATYLPLIHARIARRRDPVAAVLATQTPEDDDNLFTLLGKD